MALPKPPQGMRMAVVPPLAAPEKAGAQGTAATGFPLVSE